MALLEEEQRDRLRRELDEMQALAQRAAEAAGREANEPEEDELLREDERRRLAREQAEEEQEDREARFDGRDHYMGK